MTKIPQSLNYLTVGNRGCFALLLIGRMKLLIVGQLPTLFSHMVPEDHLLATLKSVKMSFFVAYYLNTVLHAIIVE